MTAWSKGNATAKSKSNIRTVIKQSALNLCQIFTHPEYFVDKSVLRKGIIFLLVYGLT